MLLMIDNYDSFTYNLVQYFAELGEDVRVFRNDEITVEGIGELRRRSQSQRLKQLHGLLHRSTRGTR